MDPELELLMMQMAANQYGSGSDYMESETNPYKRPGERLNYWQDIEQLIGVPLVQLAGVGAAPTDPADAPDIFQSDLGAAYGSNPVFADAFELIQGGVDPYKAMAAVRAKYDEGKYGDESLVPQKLDEFTGASSVDWDEVGAVIQQFATDNARTARETEQYQTENSPTYDEATPDGARYKNAPLGGNDPFAFAAEGDLYDWDAIQGQADQLMSSNRLKETGGVVNEQKPSLSGTPGLGVTPFGPAEQAGLAAELGLGGNKGGRSGTVGSRTRMSQTAAVVDRNNPNAFHDSRQQPMRPTVSPDRAGAARTSLANSASSAFDKSLQANLNNRRDRANKTAVRSDANTNAMKRLMAAYALIHGEMPG